jgi:formylglycine-generating enzyme required for sulfatase activity
MGGPPVMTTDAAADTGPQPKGKVFISYSRKDSAAFADELLMGLEDRGFAPFLDRHDIKPGEPWEARLGGLIEQSDTVVFVISPESVKSERCVWEVDKTLALSKRLLPVIYKSVPDADIPVQLSKLQFVRFDTAPGMMRPLRGLAEALRADLDWIREHTRLGELAARWQSRNRPESLLLRGDDLDAAKAWVGKRKLDAPPTTIQRAFLSASDQAEIVRLNESRAARGRTRRAQILANVLLVGTIVGLVGWINQEYLKEQINWYWTMRPYRVTNFDPYVLKPEAERALRPGQSFRECGKDCPEMVMVPAGEFIMGAAPTERAYDNERPQHKVSITVPFAVSKFDVTFAEWDACVSVKGCAKEGRANDVGWGRDKRPVINVSWEDANAYVAWLNKMTGKAYRLLTEAEWEYAARAGTTTAYYWGDAIGRGYANCRSCGSPWDDRQTAPVGSFPLNEFGLADMAGNVLQWVEDCYHPNYDAAPTDGSAWSGAHCHYKTARGGSWINPPTEIRSAFRLPGGVDFRNDGLGFRLGRTLLPP